ncbi:MAG: cobalamin-binding protein [Methyloceanibacter sp.]
MTNAQPKRVVSLIASATEIVCALDARDLLVGRSHECDFPPDITRLPSLTKPKFPLSGTSYDIDARVKAILQEGLSVYRVDAEKLEALRPDIVVTQDHCEVCAVSLKDVEVALHEWGGRRVEIVSLKPDCLADIWEDIAKVARALERERQGQHLIKRLKAGMATIAKQSAAARTRPRAAMIEWIDPLMAGGNWMPELVEMAGGENLFGAPGQPSPWLDWDQLVVADPDVVLVHPCGFDIARTLQEMPLLERRPGWRELEAVQRDRIIVADGNQYFNRPGPRIVESLEILAEIFHPELFSSRYNQPSQESKNRAVAPAQTEASTERNRIWQFPTPCAPCCSGPTTHAGKHCRCGDARAAARAGRDVGAGLRLADQSI